MSEYFSNKGNKLNFISSIKNLSNAFFYRNYYLKILHQLYHIKYRNNSHFVSTSLNKEIFKAFTSENGIIFHCWQPNISFFKKEFEKHKLPKQENEAFKEQKEFSFLAGILPHYISAVEITQEKKVYFNPSILENEITRKTFYQGLEIDQSNFEEVIIKTRFRKYFSQKGQKYDEYNASR